MTEFPYINSLLPDSAYKKEEVEKPPLCDSLGVRTQDPNIKSVVLYQLS